METSFKRTRDEEGLGKTFGSLTGLGVLQTRRLGEVLVDQFVKTVDLEGKLIGVISHVPVLRDRIDLRIQVLPGPDGCSRLLGPGCSRVD